MKYLVDSNVLIYAVRPEPLYFPFRAWVHRSDVVVSAISQVEVLGFHSLTTDDALFFSIEFDLLPQLAVTDAVLQRAV
ncbi:MAG: PIN domain-containing protein, partial [Hymenobacter sp.]